MYATRPSRRHVLSLGSSLIAAGAIGPAVFAATGASFDPNSIARLAEEKIRAAMSGEGIPGAAFVFFDAHGRITERHFGLADREAKTAVSAATVWPIASVTKVLTASAALTLVDRRKLDLDSDIRKYLRSVKVPDHAGPALTLRRLLSHTGGLDELPGRMWNGQSVTMPHLADFLGNGKLLRVRQAGELTAYSSYGIALVSLLIEDAAGTGYESYVADTLFKPLGMTASRYMRTANDAQGVAAGYAIEDGKAARVAHEIYITTGAGSAVCTVSDMARLGAMLLNQGAAANGARVLSPAITSEMLRQQATVHPKLPGWGLGVQLDVVGNRALAEHGGDIGGFSCLLTLAPELGVGFFTVNHGEGGGLRFAVRDAVLAAIAPFTPQAPIANASAVARLSDYVGRYRSTLECMSCAGDPGANAFPCTLGKDGRSLVLWGQTWVPVGDDLFVRDDGARKLGFARGANGRVTAVTGGAWRVGVKIA